MISNTCPCLWVTVWLLFSVSMTLNRFLKYGIQWWAGVTLLSSSNDPSLPLLPWVGNCDNDSDMKTVTCIENQWFCPCRAIHTHQGSCLSLMSHMANTPICFSFSVISSLNDYKIFVTKQQFTGSSMSSRPFHVFQLLNQVWFMVTHIATYMYPLPPFSPRNCMNFWTA